MRLRDARRMGIDGWREHQQLLDDLRRSDDPHIRQHIDMFAWLPYHRGLTTSLTARVELLTPTYVHVRHQHDKSTAFSTYWVTTYEYACLSPGGDWLSSTIPEPFSLMKAGSIRNEVAQLVSSIERYCEDHQRLPTLSWVSTAVNGSERKVTNLLCAIPAFVCPVRSLERHDHFLDGKWSRHQGDLQDPTMEDPLTQLDRAETQNELHRRNQHTWLYRSVVGGERIVDMEREVNAKSRIGNERRLADIRAAQRDSWMRETYISLVSRPERTWLEDLTHRPKAAFSRAIRYLTDARPWLRPYLDKCVIP